MIYVTHQKQSVPSECERRVDGVFDEEETVQNHSAASTIHASRRCYWDKSIAYRSMCGFMSLSGLKRNTSKSL